MAVLTLDKDVLLIETLDRVLDKGVVFDSVVRDADLPLVTRGNRISVVVPPEDDGGPGPKRPAQQMRLAV